MPHLQNPIPSFDGAFESFTDSAFRLETLDSYSDPGELVDFERYVSGEFFPTSRNEEWCDWVQEQVLRGKTISRVHAVPAPLTTYLKFEIEWRYLFNEASGEQIYIVDRSRLANIAMPVHDFWLFDHRFLFKMIYDRNGHFLRTEADSDTASITSYIQLSKQLLALAVPLRQFLSHLRTS